MQPAGPHSTVLRLPARIGLSVAIHVLRRRAAMLVMAATAWLLVAMTPSAALAVSMRDLIELSKAGLGDEVLVALIEADGTVFNLDAPKILELRAAGVSDRVITAMIRNAPPPADSASAAADGRTTEVGSPMAAEQDGAPYFVIIGGTPPAPAPPPQPTYVLPWIPWAGAQARPVRPAQPTMEHRGFGRFINDGWIGNTPP